jgi:hypothetical protein
MQSTAQNASRPRAARAVLPLAAAAIAVVVAAPAAARTAADTLPAKPPIDARAAKLTVVTKTFTPAPVTTKGFTGFQTITLKAPAGKAIVQGFATLSGGNAESVIIRSTQTVGGTRFVVTLEFPGEQGSPGRLTVMLQLIPRT